MPPTYIGRRVRDLYRVHGPRTATRLLWWKARTMTGGLWEPWLERFVPAEGHTALDVGANVGQWSLRLAQSYERVIAVEAEPKNAWLLRKRAPANVDVLPIAAGAYPCFKHMTVYADRQLSSINDKYVNGADGHAKWGQAAQQVLTPVMALEDLILDSLDFVKIDVEGAEVEVVMGMEKMLAYFRPALLVEVHYREAKGLLTNLLAEIGYRSIRIVHHPYYQATDPRYESYVWMFAH